MSSDSALYQIDFTDERMFIKDVIQRIYSDDGRGDGRVTLQGLRELAVTLRPSNNRDLPALAIPPIRVAILPAAAAFMASRADITAQCDRLYALAGEDAQLPLWQRHANAQYYKAAIALKTDPVKNLRYLPLSILLPSLSNMADNMDASRAQHEALMAALALDVYCEKAGHYPANLNELVPQFLPAVPLDHSTGQPLRYKLLNGRPLLYGLGLDGKDDGGVWTDTKTKYPRVPTTGDWVLYPPPAED